MLAFDLARDKSAAASKEGEKNNSTWEASHGIRQDYVTDLGPLPFYDVDLSELVQSNT